MGSKFRDRVQLQYNAIFSASRRGLLAEGLIFQQLRRSPVVRAVANSPVDGAIYLPWSCHAPSRSEASSMPELYADRLATVSRDKNRCCINFDVKSRALLSVKTKDGTVCGLSWSRNNPSPGQMDQTDFIIIVFCASRSPAFTWVALLPTRLFNGVLANPLVDQYNALAYTTTDPAMHPFTLPFSRLPDAIESVARCIFENAPYYNPWSGITLSSWTPRVKRHNLATSGIRSRDFAKRSIIPENIYRIKNAVDKATSELRYELNDTQPLLGEFLLIDSVKDCEYLFDHRVGQVEEDDKEEAVIITLWKADDGPAANPFSVIRLWDFILLDEYKKGFAYCIPRLRVPKELLRSQNSSVILAAPRLSEWRLSLDDKSSWIDDMYKRIVLPHWSVPSITLEMLQHYLERHKDSIIPELDNAQDQDVDLVDDDEPDKASSEVGEAAALPARGTNEVQSEATAETENVAADESRSMELGNEVLSAQTPRPNSWQGRSRLFSARGYGLQGLVNLIQNECVTKRKGLILPLWSYSPHGDYVFIQYDWTESEVKEFFDTRTLPCDLIDMNLNPKSTLCIPLVFARVYHDSEGSALYVPQNSYKFKGGMDNHREHFLNRKDHFVFIGDPCPAELSTGVTAWPHSCFFTVSEKIDFSLVRSLSSPTPLRNWLKGCPNPWKLCVPLHEVHRYLCTIIQEDSLTYNEVIAPVVTENYRLKLVDIWQEQANAIEEDACGAIAYRAHEKRHTNIFYR